MPRAKPATRLVSLKVVVRVPYAMTAREARVTSTHELNRALAQYNGLVVSVVEDRT